MRMRGVVIAGAAVVAALGVSAGVGPAWADPADININFAFDPASPVVEGTPVDMTGTATCDGAHADGGFCDTDGKPVTVGSIQIRQVLDDANQPAICANGGSTDSNDTNLLSATPDSNGQVTYTFNTTGLAGNTFGFWAHYVTGGGSHAPGTETSACLDLVITAEVAGPSLTKELAEGSDIAIEVNQSSTTAYSFVITYVPGPDEETVVVLDTVPAEWDVTAIDDVSPGGSETNGSLACGESAADLGDEDVDLARGGKLGKACSSATQLSWTPDPAAGGDVAVDVTTRQSPSGQQRFKPTSCGPLSLNDGAIAFEIDENGDIVLDEDDNPVVVAASDPLILVAVEDLDGGGIVGDGTGDEDGDGLTDADEVLVHHTDPCVADTDGDGLDDGVEVAGTTDPLDADSDDDGVNDGDEVNGGSDPNDPCDPNDQSAACLAQI